MDERIVTNHELESDTFEKSIRPDSFDEYIGQTDVKENIKVFVKAAKLRNTNLDHVLLYGPPGLGKTTLAHIIANELGSNIKTASGPTIEKSGDLAAILSTLEPNDVLFIDEIHRIPRYIEEILYSAMEDFKLDIIIGGGDGQSRNIKIDLPPFTLVGATTRAGDLSSPLRDRFGIVSKLEFYSDDELTQIVERTARVIGSKIDKDAAKEIAIRSRKTPRIANRLLKRVSDFALVEGSKKIDLAIVKKSLDRLKINPSGLDSTDIEYLMSIIKKFNGGPVGIESIASSIGEEATTIEDVIEPFLLQEGYVKRTSRGRIVTEKTYREFKINEQKTLFDYDAM
jgi:Holliday junction DNA helicase RuvB